jgi:hypothetical protein
MDLFGAEKTRRTIGSKNPSGPCYRIHQSRLVVELAEASRILEMRMTAKLFAHVAIHPEVMEEIIALEDAVALAHPVDLLIDEGLDDRRSDVRMLSVPSVSPMS